MFLNVKLCFLKNFWAFEHVLKHYFALPLIIHASFLYHISQFVKIFMNNFVFSLVLSRYALSAAIIVMLAFMSYLTATFMIEAMAAANAMVHWKRSVVCRLLLEAFYLPDLRS